MSEETHERLCKARSAKGTRPCKKPAMLGGMVCDRHGGRAPQVSAIKAICPAVTLMPLVLPLRLLWLPPRLLLRSLRQHLHLNTAFHCDDRQYIPK